jgi:hypothetical protein
VEGGFVPHCGSCTGACTRFPADSTFWQMQTIGYHVFMCYQSSIVSTNAPFFLYAVYHAGIILMLLLYMTATPVCKKQVHGGVVLKIGPAETLHSGLEITVDNLWKTLWWYQATSRDVKVSCVESKFNRLLHVRSIDCH